MASIDGRAVPPDDDPPPTARGKAPRLSPTDLDELAEVGPDDVEDAGAWWRKHAGEKWRGLIDAEPDGADDTAEGN